MDQQDLRGIGESVVASFHHFAQLPALADRLPGGLRIGLEAERFQLWAHSLGLHHQGHASLDYRVRDSDLPRIRLQELLLELQDHLNNLLAIAKGERVPAEQQQDSFDISSSSGSSSGSSYVEQVDHGDQNTFNEVAFRLQGLTDRMDALYSIATRIRNPKNRPSRTNEQLYKNILPAERGSYQKQREEVETLRASYLHRQDLLGSLGSQDATSSNFHPEELISQYASTESWIMRRTGIANARRTQQFRYWKEHASKLGTAPSQPPKIQLPTSGSQTLGAQNETFQVSKPELTGPSVATSATPLPANAIKPDDMKSVLSHQSGFSVMMDPEQGGLYWPPPPKLKGGDKYFQCPYCMILCPARYLEDVPWKRHLIHDLQPYHCTFEQCQDSNRLYGTRQDWIDHESQHVRVWHCRHHNEEFETQPDYANHLQMMHIDSYHEMMSDQLLGEAITSSERIHRGCPYCPSSFTDTTNMQRHIIHHLERFALLACPSLDDQMDEKTDSSPSIDSHHALLRGRGHSVVNDFPYIRELAGGKVVFGNSYIPLRTMYYNIDDATISCFTHAPPSGSDGFKIDYPFDIIRELRWRKGILYLKLTGSPHYYSLIRSQHEFVPCSDFTEDKLLSSSSEHQIGPSSFDIFRRQLQQLQRFVPFSTIIDPDGDELGGSVAPEPKLTLPDTPIDTISFAGRVSEWCHFQESHGDDAHMMPLEGAEEGNDSRSNDVKDSQSVSYDNDGQYDSDDIIVLGHYWSSLSQYELARDISAMGINKEAYISNPPVLETSKDTGIDPDCAICHAPADLQCDCEAKALGIAVRQAEIRMMSEVYGDIRNWVRAHSQDRILEVFGSHLDAAKEVLGDEQRSSEFHYANKPSPGLTQHKVNSMWSDCYKQYPAVLEYYYSLVELTLPADDDPAVRDPPLGTLSSHIVTED